MEQWVEFNGHRFTAPFICMCCGEETDIKQWAFGRTCALCDTGVCQSWQKGHRPEYAHPEPSWYPHRLDGKGFERFVAFVEEPTG